MKRREVFSIRIKADLKREFTEAVKEKGLSTCFVAEVLFRAWIEGTKASAKAIVYSTKGTTPIVINQHFERVVKRGSRRSLRQFTPESNCYTKYGVWVYEDVDELNSNGHAPGCHCLTCRRPFLPVSI